jgi:hypothetical protein
MPALVVLVTPASHQVISRDLGAVLDVLQLDRDQVLDRGIAVASVSPSITDSRSWTLQTEQIRGPAGTLVCLVTSFFSTPDSDVAAFSRTLSCGEDMLRTP